MTTTPKHPHNGHRARLRQRARETGLAERLGKEERDWVLELIDEKDRERLEAQEENFRRGFKLGLRLGREIFQCEDEPHCF